MKSLIANPFLVSKKGQKPYIELQGPKPKLTFPEMYNWDKTRFVNKESRRAWKKLIDKTFKKEEFHAVHVEWLDRIRDIWLKLDENINFQKYKAVQE